MEALAKAKAKLRAFHQHKNISQAKAALREHSLKLEKIELKQELKAFVGYFLQK